MSRRLAFILLLSIAAVSGLFSQDFSIRPGGFAFFPLGEPGASRYTTGGGGGLALDADFASVWPNSEGKNRRFLSGLGYTAGIEGGLWNFSGVASRGYPTLAGMGGQ